MATRRVPLVLLACGSFNPITNQHMRLFELARDHMHSTGLYQVVGGIVSPVSDGYGKQGLVLAKHRIAMAKLALQSSNWVTVDQWESQQPDWTETVVTMRYHYGRILKEYEQSAGTHSDSSGNNTPLASPCPQLKLLCGADFLDTFEVPGLWLDEHVEEVAGRFGLVCVSRGGLQPEQAVHKSDTLSRHRQNIFLVREWVRNETSATEVRRALRHNLSVKYLIPDSVIEYIHQHNLYTEDSERRNEGTVLRPLIKQAQRPVKNVNVAIRKIATLLKPDKDITHEGDHIIIKTLSTFKNYNMDFYVGKEFEEDLSGVDDRKCMTTITWEGDKLVCVQKGEIEGRGWTHWVEGDELHLTGGHPAPSPSVHRLKSTHTAVSPATIMPVDFSGKWILETSDNFEEYLKVLDIDFATRKIAISLSQTKVVTQHGDKFEFKTLSTFRNYELAFTVGVEFDEYTKGLDNRNIKCLVTWEGDKLVCTQKGEKANRGWKHWIEGGKLCLELTCEGIVCVQVFKRKE
ncbi:nicotinamide/nicotinic acid mononucleotide adenylyltransferase 1-like [Plectropomus leopardus]|uniref:nicotinamide/nicotinic acid mononucleotide adenylyltransferase 1-like n=1 Tax=Plectropomus leopardus TaxID=160734 RepID=UPI001C4C9B46|nr:nicotinamide/nicotinic acid mononucleotide adenylyltransferase 1-like [Plectropomus leopardus]